MKKNLLVFLFLSLISIGVFAQSSQEIKMFEKINKELLKQLKSSYKASAIEVNQTNSGQFYLLIKQKSGKIIDQYVANDEGTLICDRPITSVYAFPGYEQGIAVNINGKWGVYDFKTKCIVPIESDELYYIDRFEEDTVGTSFHPASEESFVAVKKDVSVSFYKLDGTVANTVSGKFEKFTDYYYKIGTEGKNGLYTLDGKEIYPQEYSRFWTIGKSGVITCVKYDSFGVPYEGAKNIKTGASNLVLPCMFYDVNWNGVVGNYTVAMHRGETNAPYDPLKNYTREYRDNGERYWDAGKYEKVIEYYEGEGYGKPWGNYFMGMAAKSVADAERSQMQHVINTLKSSDNYYKPIKYPDNYKFNNGKALQMYMMASSYFEKYLNDVNVADDDSTKINARTLRGQMVTNRNKVTDMGQDYATAYAEASKKWTQYQIRVQQEQAAQAARDQQLSNGISKIIGGLFK